MHTYLFWDFIYSLYTHLERFTLGLLWFQCGRGITFRDGLTKESENEAHFSCTWLGIISNMSFTYLTMDGNGGVVCTQFTHSNLAWLGTGLLIFIGLYKHHMDKRDIS